MTPSEEATLQALRDATARARTEMIQSNGSDAYRDLFVEASQRESNYVKQLLGRD